MRKIIFEVPAKKYFEVDADRLEQAKDTDMVRVILDYENQTAEFVWYPYNKNLSNYPYEEDDFECVKGLFEEWEKEGIVDVIEVVE